MQILVRSPSTFKREDKTSPWMVSEEEVQPCPFYRLLDSADHESFDKDDIPSATDDMSSAMEDVAVANSSILDDNSASEDNPIDDNGSFSTGTPSDDPDVEDNDGGLAGD